MFLLFNAFQELDGQVGRVVLEYQYGEWYCVLWWFGIVACHEWRMYLWVDET